MKVNNLKAFVSFIKYDCGHYSNSETFGQVRDDHGNYIKSVCQECADKLIKEEEK